MHIYIHVCIYTLSASLRTRALVLSDSTSLKNPTGKLVKMESRDKALPGDIAQGFSLVRHAPSSSGILPA